MIEVSLKKPQKVDLSKPLVKQETREYTPEHITDETPPILMDEGIEIVLKPPTEDTAQQVTEERKRLDGFEIALLICLGVLFIGLVIMVILVVNQGGFDTSLFADGVFKALDECRPLIRIVLPLGVGLICINAFIKLFKNVR